MGSARGDDQGAFGLSEFIAKQKLIILLLIIAILYILMVIFFPLPGPGPHAAVQPWVLGHPTGVAIEIRSALGGAFITFFLFTGLMQVVNFKSVDRTMAEALERVFGASVPLIGNFSAPQKRTFVANTLEALLGDSIGRSTYDYIKPMLEEDAVFRTDFEYDVFIQDSPPEAVPGEIGGRFPRDRYRWMREKLSYKLMNPARPDRDRYAQGPFTVLFLFDKTSLELLNPDKAIFARFLIELEADELDWLLQQPEQEAVRAFRALVQPSFREKFDDAGKERELTITVVRESAVEDARGRTKPYFRVAMETALTAASGESALKISFNYPYRRAATHFIFTLPQPVFAPRLTFDYNRASIEDVDYSSYYSISDPSKSDPKAPEGGDLRFDFRVRDSWVFPTSGITMVWKNSDMSDRTA